MMVLIAGIREFRSLLYLPSEAATLRDEVRRLLGAARTPAILAISDAVAAHGRQNKIDEANKELAAGDAKVATQKFDDAIEHYRNAWTHAEHALDAG